MHKKYRFFFTIMIAHVIAYLVAGGISYQLITKPLWDSPHTILGQYLRTPGDKELWEFAMVWQIPAQFLRGALIALVLMPLYPLHEKWRSRTSIIFYSALVFVLTHLSSSAPSPANIEGLVYLRPEFIQLGFMRMQWEMLFYSLLFGWMVAKFAIKSDQNSFD